MQFRDSRRTCAIICTGESAGRVDLDALKRFARIAVNDAYILAPDAEELYACDPRWWRWHGAAVERTFAGRRWCPDAKTAGEKNLTHIALERRGGLSVTPNLIYSGGVIGNSGAQAINLAYLLGARRIVLVGMDMGGSHFFGEHPKEINTSTDFAGMGRLMALMAADLDRYGVEIINTSDVWRLGYWRGGQPIPAGG